MLKVCSLHKTEGKKIPDAINPNEIIPRPPEAHNKAITPVIIDADARTIAT